MVLYFSYLLRTVSQIFYILSGALICLKAVHFSYLSTFRVPLFALILVCLKNFTKINGFLLLRISNI